MAGVQWPGAVERLALQLSQAEAANRRVDEVKSVGSSRPNRDDVTPAEYQRQLHAYVQTPEYRASDRELRIAVALSKAHDAALLRAAHKLPARRAGGNRPPLRLPRPRILPGGHVPQWWMNAINTTYAGIWRAIPSPGPELQLGSPDDPLVQEVARQARLLQASRVGYRNRDSLYEAFIPDGTPLGGRSLPPIRSLSPESSRAPTVSSVVAAACGFQPGRDESSASCTPTTSPSGTVPARTRPPSSLCCGPVPNASPVGDVTSWSWSAR